MGNARFWNLKTLDNMKDYSKNSYQVNDGNQNSKCLLSKISNPEIEQGRKYA